VTVAVTITVDGTRLLSTLVFKGKPAGRMWSHGSALTGYATHVVPPHPYGNRKFVVAHNHSLIT
jgi:hypothetical protein